MDELEKALEQIVRAFLLNETKLDHSKDNESTTRVDVQQENNNDNNTTPASIPTIVVPQLPNDEFVADLYKCLAERGVIREVHAFLRQRLVVILKASFPHVVVSGCDGNFNYTVMKLLDDFLCCHKLLFTYSVLVTELDNKLPTKQDFGKMCSRDAEMLLEDIGIRKDSELSRKLLKQYSEKQYASLLECIIGVSSWGVDNENLNSWSFLNTSKHCGDGQERISPPFNASSRLKLIDHEYAEKLLLNENVPQLEGADERFFQLQLSMERDKESQIRLAMAKFREQETERIRDEISNRLKFEFLSKEKDLLRNYDDRVKHMKHLLDREKEILSMEKARKEKELFEQRQDLIKLMEHVKQKKMKLEQALTQLNRQKANNSQSSDCSIELKVQSGETRKDDVDSISGSESIKNSSPVMTKCVKLETTIKRLKEENELLKRKLLRTDHSHVNKHHSQKLPKHDSSTDNDSQSQDDARYQAKRNFIDGDKIAFLQYTVEQQTAELEKLKQELKKNDLNSKQIQIPSKSADFHPVIGKESISQKASTQDTDLETFLAESKRRFADIEKNAELVGFSLKEVFNRKNSIAKLAGGSSANIRASGFTAGDIPPLVPKLPCNLKKSSHLGIATTQSLLPPRFMSTTTSSIDHALKSFLINQTEDIYTSEKSVKILESPHVSRLKTSTAIHAVQSTSTTSRSPQKQQPTNPTAVAATTVASSISIPNETVQVKFTKHEIRRLSTDSTSNVSNRVEPQASILTERVLENNSLLHTDNANNISAIGSQVYRDESPSPVSVTVETIPAIVPSSDVLRPPTRQLDLAKTSTLTDTIVTQNLFSLPFLSQGNANEEDEADAINHIHRALELPASTTESRGKIPMETSSSPPKIATVSDTGAVASSGVSKSAPDIETAFKSTRIPLHTRTTSDGIVKPSASTAVSSGALIQYKVPSPDTSERHDLPFKSTKITHEQLEIGTLGDVSSPKQKSVHKDKKSNSSENSLSFPDLSVSHADGNGDAFEMMAEEDFWAL